MRKSRALALVALVVMGALVPVWSPVVVSAAEETGTFAGEVSIEMDAATDGSTSRYELADASKAENFSVELTGRESTEQESVSGTALSDGEMLPVTAAGTNAPTGPANGQPEVTFMGVEETRQTFWAGSASDGSTDSISVGGNKLPVNSTVTFTGRSNTSDASWTATSQSDGATESISVDGNVVPKNQQITLTGRETAMWVNSSGSNITPSSTHSIITGNLPSVGPATGDPQLTVTGHATTHQRAGSPEHGWRNKPILGSYSSKPIHGELTFKDLEGKVSSVSLNATVDYGDPSQATVDIYMVNEGHDQTYGEGTVVKSGWTPPSSGGEITIDLDSTFVADGGRTTVEFVTTGGVDDTWKSLRISSMSEADGRDSLSYKRGGDTYTSTLDPDIEATVSPTNVAVSDGHGNSTSFGDLSDGESVTKSMPLAADATDLQFSGGGGALDYQLVKQDRYAPANPTVDIDGDGSPDASYSGILSPGESVSRDLSSLQAGTQSVMTSVDEGSVDWKIEADEVTATENPKVDVGADGSIDGTYEGVLQSGETVTVSLLNLDNGTNELAFATTTMGFDWEINADERSVTENPQLDFDGDSTPEASYSGVLEPGETVTRGVDLSLGSHETVVSTRSWSRVSVAVNYTEISESVNPSVTVNGYEAAFDGTLAKNETTELNVSTAWLANGTNTVEVGVGESLSAEAPAARVGVDYYHTAATSHSTSYNSTAWTEERTINKTFVDDQQDATLQLPFHDSVVNIKTLEIARNGSEYTRMDSANYEYDAESAVVTVKLGDMEANESVSVHAKGWRVKVNDGDITIREPTLPGDRLDTAIEVTEKGENFWLGIQNQRIVHTYNESWSQPEEYSQVTADGAQRVHLPNAGEGATARVEYTPLEVTPERGDAEVHIEDLDAQQFHLDPGRTNGGPVTIRWLNAVEDKSYALWSVTHSDTRTVEKAGADGVVFVDDDSPETLQIIASENAGDSGIGGPFGLGQSLQGGLVLALVAGSVGLVYWLQRRYGSRGYGRRDVLVLLTTAGAVTLLGMEIVAPGSASGLISSGTVPILGGAVLAILGLYYGIDYLPGGRRLKIGYLGVGVAFVGILALEVLAPGSISGTLGPVIAEALDPAIRLGGLAGVGLATYALYRWLFGNSSSGSGSSSSSSGGSSSEDDSAMTQVIVQDNDDSVTTSSGGDD
ncbi:hypothetical protein [Halorussus marinus]|uniref:hypothetical protein n=1 Tax=Halorussus marinus TaxID=2505976 RepID=UPI001092945C|nr:hypothetical protein [Halorussus marinus]